MSHFGTTRSRRKGFSLFCMVGLLVIGCVPKKVETPPPTEQPVPQQIIVGINAPAIRSLDPADTYNIVAGNLLFNLGDRLYAYKPGTNELIPQLATALPSVSEDGLTYTIPLRQGVKFHDGTDFNAEAMAFSLKRFIQNEGAPSTLLSNIILEHYMEENWE